MSGVSGPLWVEGTNMNKKTETYNNNPSVPALANVPVLDVDLLALNSKEGQEELLKLKLALSSWGCFQAIGHGISSSLLDQVREMTKKFFAIPLEEKQRSTRYPGSFEGYGDDPNVPRNRKVIFNRSERILLQVEPEDQLRLHLWPTNPPDFREVVLEYSAMMKTLSRLLIRAMAKSLNLVEDCFLQKYGDDELMGVRLNYYPARSKPDVIEGALPHSDGSGISIILQDKEVEGLQVLKDGIWYRVPMHPDALFVHVGDQLQIMSNGILKSPIHRVEVLDAEKERISAVMFHLPKYEVEIGPVEALIDENRPQQYINLKDYPQFYYDCLFQGKSPLEMVKMNSPAM